jgi:AcrR family transcriptional regulator
MRSELKPVDMTSPEATAQRRNKGFEDTHQEMIETAVRLISEKGVDALSISALARAMGINRTTVYYHFDSREALISAVKTWSAEQLAKAFRPVAPLPDRIDYITGFVLENPELMKLWIDEFLSAGEVRQRYPAWDALVDGIRTTLSTDASNEAGDAEIFSIILMTAATIAPRVFKNSVRPDADDESVIRRFRSEWLRILKASLVVRT